ncbi:hypothetical protein D1007_04323 [Hordeum vulgare]|nr:hypothetical protein D1007_04323 [Hordeum vulgare]
MVAAPMAPIVPTPVAQLSFVELHSLKARMEMLQVVRGRFPDRSRWPEIMVEIIRTATFEERARFCEDNGGMDYELIFWAIQEAEAADPFQAAKWSRFKTESLSRLNIRPHPVLELSQLPPDALPLGVNPPRVP